MTDAAIIAGSLVDAKARRGGWDLRGKAPREKIEALSIPEPNSGCWIWLAGLNSNGYGAINLEGKRMSASRASWIAFNGKIPRGLYVCHRCDVRLCVNPEHLFLGTHADNIRDMFDKGRAIFPRHGRGERNTSAKLTEGDVIAIRRSEATCAVLSSQYGVSTGLISMIRTRRIWTHI